MSRVVVIHPETPQARLVTQAAECLEKGGVVVYPTDSSYALACHIGDKSAVDRIRLIRRLDDKHNFTLVCRDLSEIALYAVVNNAAYRLMKSLTPGPYTFVLQATRQVPRRLQHPKRKTIGIRVPDNAIAQAVLETLGQPLMSTTLLLPGEDFPLTDPYDIQRTLGDQVDLVIDGGYCGFEMSTVVDLTGDAPGVLRQGKGDTAPFETA
ncbi:MAG TPA: threonylcarbamoyl-AMP synthase [Gammaproteobacteria bacterium]|nr:threonylcarbamoyl-AMP synthase [Gammaproteobacteria bacterium]